MTQAQQDEEQRERDREFPQCNTCDGRRGIDCKGHCPGCGDEPAKGEDFCLVCIRKINRGEYVAERNAAARRAVWR